MSKLKEIIHQYVVEALQELLDEENEQIDEGGGINREKRIASAFQKNPSDEKLKVNSKKAFDKGIGRVLRRIQSRRAELAQTASQSDPHDQNF